MNETCPARSVEANVFSNLISEANIPEACMRCIQRALEEPENPAVTIAVTDTFDRSLAVAREYIGEDLDADEFDKWQDISLTPPGEGVVRHGLMESGFDLGKPYGQSYVDGTESEVTDLTFNCYQEAGQ